MKSAHHSLSRPDCNNTAEVPSFTLRTALSAIPIVSYRWSVDVDSKTDLHRICQIVSGSPGNVLLYTGMFVSTVLPSLLPTTAYRWLFRDSLSSPRILWSAVNKSPKISTLGTTVPVRVLQEALVIFDFKQISKFGSFGKCVKTLCLPAPGSAFARGSMGWLGSVLTSLLQVSTKFSLNSCSQSGNSCDTSLCTSSRSSFLFLFSVSVESCNGSSRSSSLVLPLLSGSGFSVYALTSKTESCEVGEGVVEEEFADKPKTTNGT